MHKSLQVKKKDPSVGKAMIFACFIAIHII